MNSLDVMAFKKSITDYISASELPYEVKRLTLREIYDEVRESALKEALEEANKKEEEESVKSATI